MCRSWSWVLDIFNRKIENFRELDCVPSCFCVWITKVRLFEFWIKGSLQLFGDLHWVCNLYCSDALRFSVESNLGSSRVWPGVSFVFFWQNCCSMGRARYYKPCMTFFIVELLIIVSCNYSTFCINLFTKQTLEKTTQVC